MHRPTYKTIGLGGTFDHFHAGHQQFLRFAAQLASEIRVGITDQKLTLHKNFPETIQPYSDRNREVIEFCQEVGITVSTFRLMDVYGPTLENSEVQALAVTEATITGAQAINKLRNKLNLRELPVHICPLLKTDTGEILSSTVIRSGQFDREGISFSDWISQTLVLAENQKSFFKEPQGKIVSYPHPAAHQIVAVVGDRSLAEFIKHKWHYNLGIFDKKTERSDSPFAEVNGISFDMSVENNPGTISLQLMKVLKSLQLNRKSHLYIDGEEDLVTVALVLQLPLGSHIYYGQPNRGMVEVPVTEKLKHQFRSILQTK